MKHLFLLAGLWLGFVHTTCAQTVLFSEDFESGTLGGFTVVNAQQQPAWYAGPAAGNGPRWAGSAAAFVSTSGGTYGALSGLSGVVHLYRDITFPANKTDFVLRYDFRNEGYLGVSLTPTTYLPTAGVLPNGVFVTTLSGNSRMGASFTSNVVRLPASVAGTTQRLIFTSASSAQAPAALPASLDNVEVLADGLAPLGGSYTLDRQRPRSPRNFNSLTDLVYQLNTAGTSAPVAVAIPAGQRFSELVPQFGGANTHPVLLQRQGTGPNPQLQEGGIQLAGAHHLTIDGLDIVPGPGAVGPEAGYAVLSAFDQGSHDIYIRNATITMRQSQQETKGIYQRNFLLGSSGPGDSALVNRRIHYLNLQIRQACAGIWIQTSSGDVPDFAVEVGHVTVGDGTSGNIGYPLNGYEAYGMYFLRVNGLNVHDNLVQGVVSRSSYAVGIYVYDLMGPRPSVFANNRIRDIEFRHPASASTFPSQPVLVTGLWLLQAAASQRLAAGHSVQVYNNEISDLRHGLAPGAAVPTTRYGQTYGVTADLGGFVSSSMLFAHNTIAVAAPGWLNFSSNALAINAKDIRYGTVEVVNNILLNATPPLSAPNPQTVQSVLQVGIPATQTTPPLTRARADYNDLVLAAGPQRYVGFYGIGTPGGGQSYASLAAWQAATGFDTNSQGLDPAFSAGSQLRPTNPALDNAGTPLATVTTDLEGVARGRTPDVGAYEFGPVITATTVVRQQQQLQAWPVPFANELFIAPPVGTTGAVQVELMDMLGRVVRQQAGLTAAAVVSMTDLQQLPTGCYWLRLRTTQGIQLQRLAH